jgi:O-acetyl-ADP-ribose deacetylase
LKPDYHDFHVSGSVTIRFIRGNITDQEVDAIVNAANSSLLGGGGVDGAIHASGGPKILEECAEIRRTVWREGLPPGEAVLTTGGNLRAKYVIHTVGPIWSGNEKDAKTLRACYLNSLALAASKKSGSVAFPSISTGAYGYPTREASEVAIKAVLEFYGSKNKSNENPTQVVFILFTDRDLGIYLETARRLVKTKEL